MERIYETISSWFTELKKWYFEYFTKLMRAQLLETFFNNLIFFEVTFHQVKEETNTISFV